jgi:hypothetical protein
MGRRGQGKKKRREGKKPHENKYASKVGTLKKK